MTEDHAVRGNVERFFATDNRSMMGGWTIQPLEEARAEAAALEGAEREAAEKAIEERIARERAQFGADYNLDKRN